MSMIDADAIRCVDVDVNVVAAHTRWLSQISCYVSALHFTTTAINSMSQHTRRLNAYVLCCCSNTNSATGHTIKYYPLCYWIGLVMDAMNGSIISLISQLRYLIYAMVINTLGCDNINTI